jgi:hypothetical protein
MMLATGRNDDLEGPEAGERGAAHEGAPRNLRPRLRLARLPSGMKGAKKA